MKNFVKLEDFKRNASSRFTDSEHSKQFTNDGKEDTSYGDDDFDLIYGIENEKTYETKQKIKTSKRKKGRGLLLSFYEFN